MSNFNTNKNNKNKADNIDIKKKENKKKNTDEKVKFSSSVRAFQVFSTFLFVLLMIFFTLNIATSRKGLTTLCNKYVSNAELNTEYFDAYIEAGFTMEQATEMLEDERIHKLGANVMTDRALAIFKYSESYKFTLDDCNKRFEEIIREYNTKFNLGLGDEKIASLSKYSSDISGISSMFIYETPLAYRTAVFDLDKSDNIELDTSILKGFAFLSEWYFITAILIMYLIVLIILVVICDKVERDNIHFIICNTSLYPSLLGLGIYLGRIFCIPERVIITDYVFNCFLIIIIIGFIWGLISPIICKKIIAKFKDYKECKNIVNDYKAKKIKKV